MIPGISAYQGLAARVGTLPSGPPPADDVALMTLTITNASGSAKTNEPFAIPIPLAADHLGSGQTLRVYDDNGSGAKGTVLANFQVTDQSTDLNGDTRVALLSGIVPSLGSNATRKLFVEASSTAAPTGTAITASDLLATSFRVVASFDIGGTTYTFDTDDALAASATFSKTDYQCVVRSSGPISTRWYVAGPPKNSGTAHASGDGLRVEMEIVAYKAGTGAVGGGNPITYAYADVWVLNGDVARASPSHLYYGYKVERSTSLSSGTLISTDDTDADGNVIRYDWPRSAPAVTLTATGATTTGNKTGWTRASGVWPTDILGAHIRAGGGGAIVTGRTNDTTINVRVYEAMNATSFTSGNWTIEGIGHHYACTMPPLRVHVGTKPTHVCLWGNLNSAISPNSRGPMDVLVNAYLHQNTPVTYASISHTTATTNLNAMRSSDGAYRPLTSNLNPSGLMGEVYMDVFGTGGRSDIALVPGWAQAGLIRCDATGRRRIIENGWHWATHAYFIPPRLSGSPTNGQLGCPPRVDGGTQYRWRFAFPGTQMLSPGRESSMAGVDYWPIGPDNAHQPSALYIPYLFTGDLFWLRAQQAAVAYFADVTSNGNANGSGINKTPWGDATAASVTLAGDLQVRGKAWCFRDLAHLTIMQPDAAPESILHSKAHLKQRIEKTWTAAVAYGPNDAANVRPSGGERPAWFWIGSGFDIPRAGSGIGSTRGEAPWQAAFVMMMLGHLRELGLTNADAMTFWNWYANDWISLGEGSNTVPDIMEPAYYLMVNDANIFTGYPANWDEVYQRTCLARPALQGTVYQDKFMRTPTGTLTLSAASVGTGRTFTFSASLFGAGSWYSGGYIYENGSGGVARITSVGSATTVTCEILVAFSGTSPTISNIRVPGFAPADYGGEYATLGALDDDYAHNRVVAMHFCVDAGVETTRAQATITRITSRPSYSPQFFWYETEPR